MVNASLRKNVWLGTSVENADYLPRIDALKTVGGLAAVTFLSFEPLLGPMPTLGEHLDGIDWVIAGGESGPDARPTHPEWVRSVRDQCEYLTVPFHFKQWGEWLPDTQNPRIPCDGLPRDYSGACRVGTKKAGRLLDGVLHDAFPELVAAAI
jgi:protein gp37